MRLLSSLLLLAVSGPEAGTSPAPVPPASSAADYCGAEATQGQVNEPCIDLKKQQILFPELLFEIDKAALSPKSFGTLEKLAPLILRHPELGPLEVRGHRAYHPSVDLQARGRRDLTELRAESVKQFLVARGVTPERLSAHGYKATMPIVKPATSLKNRRIEIVILQPPAHPSPR